jgi:hypothetical protein
LHQLVHAHDKVAGVNAQAAYEPSLKMATFGFILVNDQVERNEEDNTC